MIHIDKGPEPHELVEHRASSPTASYADFREIEVLRAVLVRDQGHLCAYCMQRISPSPTGMKIEHWYPQHPSAVEPRASSPRPAARGPLDFGNLLGVCTGGQHRPPAEQHCDTRKGNRLVTIDPLDRPERFLRYGTDGSIRTTTPALQSEIDDVLNLNLERLRHNRMRAWDGTYQMLKRGGDRSFRTGALLKQVERLRRADHGGRRAEYCGYVAFFLEKKLRRAQAAGAHPRGA